ncbi:MAG TPA: ATP synthase F0 subunit C [Acholeplasma sp.]|mgnify:CR=1 FL=1|jgi:F-type H+-transporting ATPase subunit c|nr:ATP synthase F0 subunit C [Acholeplasma sp.]
MFNLLIQTASLVAEYNEHFVRAAAYLGAAIAILTAGAAGVGQGLAAAKAVEAVGRQPEASGKITVTMIVGQVMVETSGIYALIIALILSGK